MRPSDNPSPQWTFLGLVRRAAPWLLWYFPLVLAVPNLVLDFTEHYTWASRVANATLPLGVYMLLMTFSTRVGRTTLMMLPLAVFAAFQIVLLNLYGESIIAVDMFINVATTNATEVGELLGNLLVAIGQVVLLYVPPLTLAVCLVMQRWRLDPLRLPSWRRCGLWLTGIGILAVLTAMATDTVTPYRLERQLFPVNVTHNLIQAVRRTAAAKQYKATSSSYAYHAHTQRSDTLPETYVVVIGETARADHWPMGGYPRQTTPRLSRRGESVTSFPRAVSESNTTHKSVPMLLGPLEAQTFADSVARIKSLFQAFGEAGYDTWFISNQRPNGSYIDFYGEQAAHHHFILDSLGRPRQDMALVGELAKALSTPGRAKRLIVLHAYGSHFNYRERYPRQEAHYLPDDNTEAAASNRPRLVNAYDNTIRYTDHVLDSLITVLSAQSGVSALMYTSDHGEDIFDDARGRFLHASPNATYYQLHVPLMIWASPGWRDLEPGQWNTLQSNRGQVVSTSQALWHTLAEMAGLVTPKADKRKSLVSGEYRPPAQLVFLNDYLEAVPLDRGHAELHTQDVERFHAHGINVE